MTPTPGLSSSGSPGSLEPAAFAASGPVAVAWQRTQDIGLSLVAALPALGVALVVYGLFWLGGALLRAAVVRRAGQPEHVARIFGRLARWAVLTLGLLVAVTVTFPSLTAQSLLSTLGIGGVAIGFAFRDIFTNLLSGLILLVTQPFRIGDQIVAGSAKGTVEDIQMRATVIRTADNRRILIPNAELFTGRVQVNTAYPLARAGFSFLVPHASGPQRASGVTLRTLQGLDMIEQVPPPSVIATELNGDGVTLSVRYWVQPPARRELALTTSAVILAVHRALEQEDIALGGSLAVELQPPAASPADPAGGPEPRSSQP
ncbi:mechanosensitive ion channel family protein [Deinococcus radiophilus]|uniref:Mechanosensitive ion channel family protein n=1 Tax=Deinococcus radiophilus TaxID=32062 RepID=A0A3S0ICI3_9DEIO|nr:mechanosensitive ion channel family protein [Deinococcus radiophilus]RTR29435.1 mechanosensitive ion channel family protein [Deinococcus radiophilus]